MKTCETCRWWILDVGKDDMLCFALPGRVQPSVIQEIQIGCSLHEPKEDAE